MGSVSSVMPNFNPASVTNEIQKLDPRKSPKKAPKPAFWTRNLGLAGVRCFQPKLERHLEIRHSVIVRKLFAFRLSQLTCLFRPDGEVTRLSGTSSLHEGASLQVSLLAFAVSVDTHVSPVTVVIWLEGEE